LKNFTFKVFPTPLGLENKQEEQVALKPIWQPIVPAADAMEPETAKKKPCPPCSPSPVPPQMPCPPMGPMPVPPPMPCPPMGSMPPQMPCPMVPMPPQMPCPPGGYGMGPSPDFRLAHAYVPWQYYNAVFSPAEALHRGTLFPELCMPQGEYGPCEGPRPCKVYFGGGVPYGCE
jgi:hypothetical protein